MSLNGGTSASASAGIGHLVKVERMAEAGEDCSDPAGCRAVCPERCQQGNSAGSHICHCIVGAVADGDP